MGVVNAGTIAGAVLVPLLVPTLVVHFGWRSAFIGTGLLGLVWLLFWIPMYRRPQGHPRVSRRELALIESDPVEASTKVRWITLLKYPQVWAFALAKLITDPLWWFYMTWFPDYLNTHHHLNIAKVGPPLFVIYGMATVGSLGGGWLSSRMLKSGYSVNASRKTAMLVCAIAVIPVIFAANATSLWVTVALLGLATAAHQGFSSNLYTLVSDMFPKHACGAVAGLGGSAGYMMSTFSSSLTGLVLSRWTNHNYGVLFMVVGLGYLVAFIIIQILAPGLKPVEIPIEQPAHSGRGFDVI